MTEWLQVIWGGDLLPENPSFLQIVARSGVVYLFGLVAIRLGKSRLLSRASPLDVIVAFILGSLLSRGINGSATLSGTAVAVSTLVGLHSILTALACRYHCSET